MIDKNILLSFTRTYPADCSQSIRECVTNALSGIDAIYSYIVTAEYANNEMSHYTLRYLISQTNTLNTIVVTTELIDKITTNIINATHKSEHGINICFEQPSLELMLKAYQPYIKNAANITHNTYPCIEYLDAYQNICLVITRLYTQGYYIHKRLVDKTYNNDILMYLRKHYHDYDTISLDSTIHTALDDKDIALADVLVDKRFIETEEYNEHISEIQSAYLKLKSILIHYMGERQFEQFERAYTHKTTDNWARRKMVSIKQYLAKHNITLNALKENSNERL